MRSHMSIPTVQHLSMYGMLPHWNMSHTDLVGKEGEISTLRIKIAVGVGYDPIYGE